MVATISILGSASPSGAGGTPGNYYVSLTNPSYYTAGGEPPGRWYGEGAKALGLSGRVDALHFEQLLSGHRPDGTSFKKRGKRGPAKRPRLKPSRGKARSEQVPGYDLCFSVPKSVSGLWATGGFSIRYEVEAAFDVAVSRTLDWFSSNVPLVRRGRGGTTEQFAELVIAQFDHATSRVTDSGAFEPNLHRHCVIANIARGADCHWTAVNSRRLLEWTRTLGPMFRATLAEELVRRLGVRLTRPTDERGKLASWFEIADFSKALCSHWSSRRDDIEAAVGATEGLGSAAAAKAREKANLKTRKAKPKIPARAKLFESWETVAKDFGMSHAAVERLCASPRPIDGDKVFESSWKEAIERLESSQSTFTLRGALKELCEAAQAKGMGGNELARRLEKHLTESKEIRCLGEVSGEKCYVTESTWQLEKELIKQFDALRSTKGATVSATTIENCLQSLSVSDDQKEAVTKILKDTRSLRTLDGVAGAGKSTTLNAVRDALEREGYTVVGGAIAGLAKEELTAKAGIVSRTIASQLYHLECTAQGKSVFTAKEGAQSHLRTHAHDKSNRVRGGVVEKNAVFVVDEAGMIDSETMLRICNAATRLGLTLILVGDCAQLQPILAGGPMLHLLRKDDSAALTKNLRQLDPADRKAADDLRRGDAKSALENYAERGRLTVSADRVEALTTLISKWTEDGGATRPASHVIFTSTRAEARAASRLAQKEREARGQIAPEQSLKNGRDRICLGDRVLFHKNSYSDGIRNGYRGEVTAVDGFLGRLTIRLDGPEQRVVTIRLRDFGPDGLTLAYAQTTHKGQGQTVDNAYLLVGGLMADREMAYVQATRGRESTHLFVDEAHAGVELEDLARALSRSRSKELAHDIAERTEAAVLKKKRRSQEL